MIEALDDWIIESEFVKNPPDYDLLPDRITLDSTHQDYIELLINLLENMI